MNRTEVEAKLKEFGFVSKAGDDTKQDETVYTMPNERGYGSVILNGTDLFVNEWRYMRVEIDNYGIIIRLYCDIHYIGCILESWNNVEKFELRKGID